MMDSNHNPVGHETSDADVRAIGITGSALFVAIAIVLWIVYGMFQYLAHHSAVVTPANPMAESDRQQFPPVPRIDDHPTIDLIELHAQENHILSTYGWTDKKAGVVRIPIDRAMELQLERGFPVRKQAVNK